MKTRGMAFLEKNRIAFTLHEYDYELKGAEAASAATGIPLERMIKTLVVCDDPGRKFLFVLMPGAAELDLKKLAAACGEKKLRMSAPADAERLTGYQVGGLGPFGSKKALPSFMDQSLLAFERVGINGGARGAILSLAPLDIVRLLTAQVLDLQKRLE